MKACFCLLEFLYHGINSGLFVFMLQSYAILQASGIVALFLHTVEYNSKIS